MNFNDLRNSTRRTQYNYGQNEYQHNKDYQYSSRQYNRHEPNFRIKYFFNTLQNDRKLKKLLLLGTVVVLIVVIALLILLLPVLIRIFEYIGQNGIEGVIEYLTGLLDKIWEGTGK